MKASLMLAALIGRKCEGDMRSMQPAGAWKCSTSRAAWGMRLACQFNDGKIALVCSLLNEFNHADPERVSRRTGHCRVGH